MSSVTLTECATWSIPVIRIAVCASRKFGVLTNSAIPPPAMLMRAYPLGAGAAPCPSNLLLRRAVVEQVSGFEEDFRGLYQLYEDQAFLVKVFLHATVFVSGECWARYRQHPDLCMSRVAQAGQYYAVRGFFLSWLEAYLRQQGVQDPALQQTLQWAMRPYRYAALYQPLNLVQNGLNNVKEGNPHAMFVGNLTDADHIPARVFDCVILTQTLHLIYDVPAAQKTVYRILKPGGVLLATVPGISQISEDEWGDEWYWSFTPAAARRTIAEVFPLGQVWVESHGNVLAASAFPYGLAAKELRPAELDSRDPCYPMLVTIRAVKPKEAA